MPDVHASLVIDAPIAQVWEQIKDFHDFSWAPGIVTSCVDVGDTPGNTPGAKRLINDALVDRLLEYDAGTHGYKYSIEEAPSPVSPSEVSNFVGHLRLSPAGDNQTLAEYSGSWEAQDDAAVEFMDGIYSGLLKELAQKANS
jgi:hypothetical protein